MHSTPSKKSNRGTVTYEIEMLKFCFQGLHKVGTKGDGERNLYLEGFLLHFRNLVRFLSGKHHREDKGDTSLARPAMLTDGELVTDQIDSIRAHAAVIDDKYFEDISRFLQHCTLARGGAGKEWNLDQMFNEISPVIEEFERAFPRPLA